MGIAKHPCMTLLGASLLAAVAGPAAWGQTNAPSTLEKRIIAKLTADPALAATLGSPAPQMAKVAALAGTWEVKLASAAGNGIGTRVVTPIFGGRWLEIRGAYPRGMQDVGFLGYNSGTGKWQSVTIDNFGNANTMEASEWDGDRLVFEGDIVAMGVGAHVRQTLTKISDDEFRVTSEERVDGAWQRIDEHHYTRDGE